MQTSALGNTGLSVGPIGFGAFKIGRNLGAKYPAAYELPDEPAVEQLLNGVLDLGVNLVDTAPAYGLSEERIGKFLSHRRGEFVLSTKVGESFEDGRSTYDFSERGVRESVERSLRRLQTEVLDVVFIHSNGDDRRILEETDCPSVLDEFKARGTIRAVGFSGKTPEGALLALSWADVLMVEYHLNDRSHESVIEAAAARGVGVVVKKGLSSGRLPPADAVRFVLSNQAVSTMVIGGLNLSHLECNIKTARELRHS